MSSPMVADVAAKLIAVPGVVAVALGGSRAKGAATTDSDIDLGLYYDAAAPPARDALNALARELDDRHPADAVTAFGEWGPWIDGGAWLRIGGDRVDWLFRDLARLRRVIADCRAGRPEVAHQLGHPHAFVQVLYAANDRYCTNEKGALGEVTTFARKPETSVPVATRVLAAPGAGVTTLEASVAECRLLVDAVAALA